MIAVLVVFTQSVVIWNGLDIMFKNLKIRIADEEPPYSLNSSLKNLHI